MVLCNKCGWILPYLYIMYTLSNQPSYFWEIFPTNKQTNTGDVYILCSVPKVIDFPRYNTKCSLENEILHTVLEIFRVVSRFPRYISCYILENRLITFGTVELYTEQYCLH